MAQASVELNLNGMLLLNATQGLPMTGSNGRIKGTPKLHFDNGHSDCWNLREAKLPGIQVWPLSGAKESRKGFKKAPTSKGRKWVEMSLIGCLQRHIC